MRTPLSLLAGCAARRIMAAVLLAPAICTGAEQSIGGGVDFTAALAGDGTVWTWGSNEFGQLGYATANNADSLTPKRAGVASVTSIALGYQHALALRDDGTVWAWGSTYGSTPAPVSGLSSIIAVAAGLDHSLALRSDGTVWSWGSNVYGQLGDNTTTSRSTPAQVPGLDSIVAIAANWSSSVALKSDGTLTTWGANFRGELGDGTTTNRSTPAPVTGLTDVIAVQATGGNVLALRGDGTVWSWGSNQYGELGDGTTASRSTPARIQSLSNIAQIARPYVHSLALTRDGTVYSWGGNTWGELGNGTTTDRPTPALISGLSGVARVATGGAFSLALRTDGSLLAWGKNIDGELGDGTTTTRTRPTAVHGEGNTGTLNLGVKAPIQAVAPPVIVNGKVSVTATATFPPTFVGRPIFLFAYVPSSLLPLLGVSAAKDTACVLVEVTPNGFHDVGGSASGLGASGSNVQNQLNQSINMMNNVPLPEVQGSTLCLGAGSNGTEATTPGNYACPTAIPGGAGAICQPPSPSNNAGEGKATAKTLGSRALVTPQATFYGGFELSADSTVYILVRGNSLGTLNVTQSFLDAPRLRFYDGAGHDMLSDASGPGFSGCLGGVTASSQVINFYKTRGGVHGRDACVAQNLAAGAYTFSVTPGSGSSPTSGEVLFEVSLGAGSGSLVKTLGARAAVTQAATLYGGFELGSSSNVYILVRGNSLGTLGITQGFLDAPRVRIYNAQGQDMITSGTRAGFNGCEQSRAPQVPVLEFYRDVRHQPAVARDACIAQSLSPGVYTFTVTPSIPGVTSTDAQSTPASGEVLFEVSLH